MVEWTGVVLAEPRMLEGVRAVNFVCSGEEEPEVVEGLSGDELKMGKVILIGGGLSEIGHQGVYGCLG